MPHPRCHNVDILVLWEPIRKHIIIVTPVYEYSIA